MAEELLVKMSPRPPADLCALCEIDLDDAARPLLEGDPTSSVFLRALIQAGLHQDAVAYLAHGLPKREAVWWACQCAREAGAPVEGSKDALALAAAEAWVYKPDDDHREIAQQRAAAAGMLSTGGLVAQAVGWSGGSLAPPDLPEVPPPEFLTGRMAAAAIVLAGTRVPGKTLDEALSRFLARGIEIAMGKQQGGAPA